MAAAAEELTLPSADPESVARVRARPRGGDGADPPLLMLGTVVAGSYELDALLGSGGMGQVFRAHDVRLGRRVAVKVARAGAAGALRTEGATLARFDHPSIVRVLHAGTHRDVDFLVLEHVDGCSLRTFLGRRQREGRRLAVSEAVSLLGALAQALDVVHRAGLSHGDVKPENVMLARDRRMVLTDFGLAREESARDDEHVSGSPSYMSPEVIAATVEPGAWHGVDLYALGIVGYELLAGRTPFERGNRLKTLHAHLTDRPFDLRELRPHAPPALADLLLRLTARSPADRPSSAAGVARSLRLVHASLAAAPVAYLRPAAG